MIRSHHDLPPPVFVGFFPKLTMEAPPHLAAAGVSEIGAVTNCMSSPPDGWIDAWRHNDLGFYDSEEAALSVVPPDDAPSYDLYAYELIPVEYAEELELMDVAPAPGRVPSGYEFLGYDVVTRSMADFFECSPLSCNGGATTIPVNRHCLVATLEDAYTALLRIGDASEGYEPGPYYLFAVHRRRRAA